MRESLDNPANMLAIDMDKSMELVGDEAMAKEMLTLMHEKLPQEIEKIVTAFEASDYTALAHAAHKLVGGVAYCGVSALRSAARMLEYAAEDGLKDSINSCYQQFQTELTRFQSAYDALMAA